MIVAVNRSRLTGPGGMMDKDEYVDQIQQIRAMLASGAEAKCSCPKTKCEWHADCYNCVRLLQRVCLSEAYYSPFLSAGGIA